MTTDDRSAALSPAGSGSPTTCTRDSDVPFARQWGIAHMDRGIYFVAATRRECVNAAGYATPVKRRRIEHGLYYYTSQGGGHDTIIGRIEDLRAAGFDVEPTLLEVELAASPREAGGETPFMAGMRSKPTLAAPSAAGPRYQFDIREEAEAESAERLRQYEATRKSSAAGPRAEPGTTDPECGSQGVDSDGRCLRCGKHWEDDEFCAGMAPAALPGATPPDADVLVRTLIQAALDEAIYGEGENASPRKLDEYREKRREARDSVLSAFATLTARLQQAEEKAAKYDRINTPEIADFLSAVENEALHQRERWGVDQDGGKEPADWFWLVGYLAGKALHDVKGKRLHHIITTAAALLNWHGQETGHYARMRPGIDPAAHPSQEPSRG